MGTMNFEKFSVWNWFWCEVLWPWIQWIMLVVLRQSKSLLTFIMVVSDIFNMRGIGWKRHKNHFQRKIVQAVSSEKKKEQQQIESEWS